MAKQISVSESSKMGKLDGRKLMAKGRNRSQKRINRLPEQFNQWYNGETSKSEDMGNMYRDWDLQLHLQHRPNTIKE